MDGFINFKFTDFPPSKGEYSRYISNSVLIKDGAVETTVA